MRNKQGCKFFATLHWTGGPDNCTKKIKKYTKYKEYKKKTLKLADDHTLGVKYKISTEK